MKKVLLFIICILLLVSLVNAVKPTQTSVSTTTGLTIEVPVADFIIQNNEVKTNIHVYNNSNGVIMKNDTTSCEIHVYNQTGFHQAKLNMEFNGDDFYSILNSSNFSDLGFRSFVLWCNTSNEGGFTSGSIRVTADGEDDTKTDSSSAISATLFLLFIVGLLFAVGFKVDFVKMKWANNIIKRGFITVALFVLMWNSAILSTIVDNANLDLVSAFLQYMIMFGWAGYVMAVYFVLASLFEILAFYKLKKGKKRFGEEENEF